MELTLSGSPEIDASREHVWRRLLDPEAVAASTPGVESVEATGDHRYAVHASIGLGAFRIRLALKVELHDLEAPSSAGLRLSGEAHNSALDIRSSVRLEPLSPTRVRLDWTAVTAVTGALAHFGGSMLEGAARTFTERFWNDFAARAAASADHA